MTARILHTGGTIGSWGTPLAPMPGAAFASAWARLMGPPAPAVLEPPLDSAEATPADWLRLADAAFADDAPLLMLHGTDTLAWSAAMLGFLSCLWTPEGAVAARRAAPILLTGSQLPLLTADGSALRPDSDARANIAAAEAALAGAGPGVHIAFHGRLLPGLRSVKRHSLDPDAFACPNGPAPLPPAPPAEAAALRAQLAALAPHLGARAVLTLHAAPNAPAHLAAQLDALAGVPGLGALVLMGYGTGNLPGGALLAPRLAALAARGVLLAATTQLFAGPAEAATYSAGSWLAGAGAMPSADRTLPAIGAKLHLLLALAALHGWDTARCRAAFAANHAGEGPA